MRLRYTLPGTVALAALGLIAPVTSAVAAPPDPGSYPALADTNPSAASSYTSVGQLLNSVAVTEAAAHQGYQGYAAAAARSGRTDLAGVWRAVGQVEHQDHYLSEITSSGVYSDTDNIVNLQIAITQAGQAAAADQSWAAQAPAGSAAAAVLLSVAERERAYARLLTQALDALRGHGVVPAAPPAGRVTVRMTPYPNYSGAFYESLTGHSDSALAVAAWQWAEYQWMAQIAVSTGQARLGALLSGLEARETQHWIELSNVAGYVNGIGMNLLASIDAEQAAIGTYTAWATRADQLGGPDVASLFRDIRTDEEGHGQTFTTDIQPADGRI